MKKLLLLLLVSLSLFGCGEKTIEGTFVSQTQDRMFTFRADGIAIEANREKTIGETTYTVQGDEIKLGGFDILRLRRLPNGNISSMGYGELIKK